MPKQFLFFTLFLCFVFTGLRPQSSAAFMDSLKQALKNAVNDTDKVKLLNELDWKLLNTGNYDSSLLYANRAKALALKSGYKNGLAKAYSTIGSVYIYQGNYPEALMNHLEALKIRKETGDKKGIAASCNNIGSVYDYMGNIPEALNSFLACLKSSEEAGNKNMVAISRNNIGLIYKEQGNLNEALKNYLVALKINEETGNKDGLSAVYNNMGNVYLDLGNHPQALTCFMKSLEIHKDIDDPKGIAGCYNGIGNVYFGQKNYGEALKNYEASLKIQEAIGSKPGIAGAFVSLSSVYYREKDFKTAIDYASRSLVVAMEAEDLNAIKEAHEVLSEALEGKAAGAGSMEQEYLKRALVHYKLFTAARDSLLNEENTKKTTQAEMQYEFDKREAAAKLEQEKKEAVSAAENKKQKIIILSICGILVLVLAFAIFAYRSFLQKQKANVEISRQKHLIEEKQKEILDSIYYARRIQRSLMTNENYVQKSLKRLLKNA